MRALFTLVFLGLLAVGFAAGSYILWPSLAGQVSVLDHGPDLTIDDKRYHVVRITLADRDQYNRVRFEWDRPVSAASIISSPAVGFDRFDGGDGMEPATLWQPDFQNGKAGDVYHFLLPLQDEGDKPAMVTVIRQGGTGPLSGEAGMDIPNERLLLFAGLAGLVVFVLLVVLWLPNATTGYAQRRKAKKLEGDYAVLREELAKTRAQLKQANADAKAIEQGADRELAFWRDAVRDFLIDRNHDRSETERMLDNISVNLRAARKTEDHKPGEAKPVIPGGPLVAERD